AAFQPINIHAACSGLSTKISSSRPPIQQQLVEAIEAGQLTAHEDSSSAPTKGNPRAIKESSSSVKSDGEGV
ncbi:hypothetical protein Dimus_018359, partial [Dionaea muscipula]